MALCGPNFQIPSSLMGLFILSLFSMLALGASLPVNFTLPGLNLTLHKYFPAIKNICCQKPIDSSPRSSSTATLPNGSPIPVNTLPNPYPVPGTSITLFFHGEPQPPLPPLDVRFSLCKAGNQIINYLQAHPDDHDRAIPGGYYEASWGRVMFGAVSYDRQLTYNQTLETIYGLLKKTNTDGNTQLAAEILLNTGPQGRRAGYAVVQPASYPLPGFSSLPGFIPRPSSGPQLASS